MARLLIIAVLAALPALALSACGSKGVDVNDTASIDHGARLFADRCSGCHTLNVAGTQGSATKVRDRERVDGPNFNTRPESAQNVLYAIENGGFSGAIMPENIVVGRDAKAVAAFLAKYAGNDAKAAKTPGG
jgi:mono/diheme cytochrome c family protein